MPTLIYEALFFVCLKKFRSLRSRRNEFQFTEANLFFNDQTIYTFFGYFQLVNWYFNFTSS